VVNDVKMCHNDIIYVIVAHFCFGMVVVLLIMNLLAKAKSSEINN
jgi:uncharacterized membrane protein